MSFKENVAKKLIKGTTYHENLKRAVYAADNIDSKLGKFVDITSRILSGLKEQSTTIESTKIGTEELVGLINDVEESIGQLVKFVDKANNSLEKLYNLTNQVAGNSESTASSVEQISASIEQISKSIKGVAG
ncbi:methyl-accepting chemotaxis protein, partial [Thermoanaerobacterium saccharolyticum]